MNAADFIVLGLTAAAIFAALKIRKSSNSCCSKNKCTKNGSGFCPACHKEQS